MRSRLPFLLLTFALSSYAASRYLAVPAAPNANPHIPLFKHVFLVVEENENYADVIGNTRDMPYLNMLAGKYGLATNYFANTHPSINNYFLLTAGRSATVPPWVGDLSDAYPREVDGANVASVLSSQSKTWKSYVEDLPHNGYVGDDTLSYAKRHNPFAYFTRVRSSPAQRANIVSFAEFRRDLQRDTLPDYSLIVPNVYNDGHDNPLTRRMATCGDHLALENIDNWLRKNVSPLIESDTFRRGGLLVIVFDEACEGGRTADWRYDPSKPKLRGGGHVAGLIISSRTPPGTRSDVLYHHESVLRLMLRALGVEQLPGGAATSPDMDALFPQTALVH